MITMTDLSKLIDELRPDPWGWQGTLVKQTATHAIIVMPMLFNDRIIMAPLDDMSFFEYGWCYDKGENHPAIMAALLWEPDIEPEPLGFKKRIIGLDAAMPIRQVEIADGLEDRETR